MDDTINNATTVRNGVPEIMSRLEDLIYSASAIRFSSARSLSLWEKIKSRAEKSGCGSLDIYHDMLKSDPFEMGNLLEEITTKETYFFRIPSHFEALSSRVLPEIEDALAVRAVNADGGVFNYPIRIWSAGCSTGEEPYSIAATVKSALKYLKAWKIEILATDVSTEALKRASAGCYEWNASERIPEEFRRLVLKCETEGQIKNCPNFPCAVHEELKKMLHFRRFNLKELIENGAGPSRMTLLGGSVELTDLKERFDAIFCRNVMIYFDFSAQQKLISRLYDCLKPGGYLFTGDAEQLHVYDHKFQPLSDGGAYYYRKPRRSESAQEGCGRNNDRYE